MPALQSFPIGDVTVTRIIERDGPWHEPLHMYPDADADTVERHLAAMPEFAADRTSGMINLTFQSFLLRTPSHTILIDTCVGQHEDRREGLLYPKERWLGEFAAAGVTFEDVDIVFCTHMHVDHVGWNTRLIDGRWVPTFPNARYLFGRRELEHWQSVAAAGSVESVNHGSYQDSVLPVVEAGQAVLVDDGHTLYDGIWVEDAPGHSPGNAMIRLKSAQGNAVLTGDTIQHPLQLARPDWSSAFCDDPVLSRESRTRLIEAAADTDTLVLTGHFPDPVAGRIVSATGGGFRFRF